VAARRGKSQARRNQGNGGLPGWAWLVLGIVLTVVVLLAAPRLLRSDKGDGFFRPRPNPDATPAPASSEESVADEDSAPKGTQYDFYTLLPADEVAMSDAELAAASRAEAARSEDAADLAEPAEPEPAAPAPAPATTSIDGDAAYILQAGAFGSASDAEAVKARIALLGLSARVEAAEIQGRTVYRVRMGPYATASELAGAKAKLTGGGLPAMAIKAR
jgi:cell division protein FtsN